MCVREWRHDTWALKSALLRITGSLWACRASCTRLHQTAWWCNMIQRDLFYARGFNLLIWLSLNLSTLFRARLSDQILHKAPQDMRQDAARCRTLRDLETCKATGHVTVRVVFFRLHLMISANAALANRTPCKQRHFLPFAKIKQSRKEATIISSSGSSRL